MVATPLFWKWK